MNYICSECKRDIENLKEGVSCPYCGSRMIKKNRSGAAKEIKTD